MDVEHEAQKGVRKGHFRESILHSMDVLQKCVTRKCYTEVLQGSVTRVCYKEMLQGIVTMVCCKKRLQGCVTSKAYKAVLQGRGAQGLLSVVHLPTYPKNKYIFSLYCGPERG